MHKVEGATPGELPAREFRHEWQPVDAEELGKAFSFGDRRCVCDELGLGDVLDVSSKWWEIVDAVEGRGIAAGTNEWDVMAQVASTLDTNPTDGACATRVLGSVELASSPGEAASGTIAPCERSESTHGGHLVVLGVVGLNTNGEGLELIHGGLEEGIDIFGLPGDDAGAEDRLVLAAKGGAEVRVYPEKGPPGEAGPLPQLEPVRKSDEEDVGGAGEEAMSEGFAIDDDELVEEILVCVRVVDIGDRVIGLANVLEVVLRPITHATSRGPACEQRFELWCEGNIVKLLIRDALLVPTIEAAEWALVERRVISRVADAGLTAAVVEPCSKTRHDPHLPADDLQGGESKLGERKDPLGEGVVAHVDLHLELESPEQLELELGHALGETWNVRVSAMKHD